MSRATQPRLGVSRKLNLGAGEDYREGWTNLDVNDRYDPDVVYDLDDADGWPFFADEFAYVLASHVFEHLRDPTWQFEEAARVLEPGGILEVRVPLGVDARTDITHRTEWTYDTPLQFAQNWREFTDDYQFAPSVPFDLERRDVRVWSPLPGRAGHLVEHVVDRLRAISGDGVWLSALPISGELTAVYRRHE